jgi:AraC family transcriptional regulator
MPTFQISGKDAATGEDAFLGKREWITLSSDHCPWRHSLKLERHSRPAFERPEIVLPTTISFFDLGIEPRASVRMEWRLCGGPLRSELVHNDTVSVISAGAFIWGRCLAPSEVTFVSFTPEFLRSVIEDSSPSGGSEFTNRFCMEDKQLRALGVLLANETAAGCPNGRLYGESLGSALAIYMLNNHAVFPPQISEKIRSMGRYKLHHVLEYLAANLASEPSLQELATFSGLSLFHFCRSFKQSTGVSPHQYILRLRVEEAKRLLKNTSLSTGDIGELVGFYDQSHFSGMFRRFTGATPTHWRSHH